MDTVHLSYSLPNEAETLPAGKFLPAIRIQRSLLAGLEKRTLLWLARHTPRSINSDHLTALAALAMLAAGICYACSRWWSPALLFADLFLALNWLGDSLDGTLARFRNRQRPRYGFYVDHLLDAFGACFLLAGLAVSGFMHPQVAIGILLSYLMLSIEGCLATYTLRTFTLSFFKLSPTELRILLAIGSVTLLWRPVAHLWGRSYLLFDIGGCIAIAGMFAILLFAALTHTRALYRQEPLP